MTACDECGDPVREDGCEHNGRSLCCHCLHRCPECLDAIRDDHAAELAIERGRGL